MADSEMESKMEFGKVPTFDGDEAKYPIWWSRFSAVAKLKGFHKALLDGGDPDLPDYEDEAIDVSTAEGKRKQAAVRRNDVAISCFTMAFTTEALIGLIYKAQEDIWPNGLAYKVVEELKALYRPKDKISRVELRARLNKVKMNDSDNPRVMFEQLAAIQNMFKSSELEVDEEDLMAVILGQAPKAYANVLATEQQMRGDLLTLKDLEKAMTIHWRINGSVGGNASGEGGTEMALTSFVGTCYKCKKQGHKAYQCKDNGGNGDSEKKTGNRRRFHGNCNNCGKKGHKRAQCWELEENKKNRPGGASKSDEHGAAAVEFSLMSGDRKTFPDNAEFLKNPCVWIADSGATTHSTPHRHSVSRVKQSGTGTRITMGNGVGENVNVIGDINGTVCDGSGNKIYKTTLTDVCVCPTAAYNLFSLTKMTAQGWSLNGDKDKISIQKGKAKLVFDIKITTSKGALYCMYLKPDSEIACVGVGKDKPAMSVDVAHELLGHTDERRTRATAKHLGWSLEKGEMKSCEGCTAGKARQNNVPKESGHVPATKNGERVFLDLSTVKQQDGVRSKPRSQNWRMVVDERTQLKFSTFHDKKDDMVEVTCQQFEKWRAAGKAVAKVRCDNAGENKLLEKRAASSDWKLNIEFEYTARDTPQQNHLAEIALAVIANRGRALMHSANVPYDIRFKVWKEAFKTATLLDGLTVIEIDGKKATRFEHWKGTNPAFAGHLRTWGEAGTVKTKTKTTPKLFDKGVHCMFVGYAESHDGDCYRMWDPKTGRVHETRDVIWLSQMHYSKKEDNADFVIEPVLQVCQPSEGEVPQLATEQELYSNDVTVGGHDAAEADADTSAQGHTVTRSGRVSRPPRRLINEGTEFGSTAMTDDDMDDDIEDEIACVGAGIGGGFENTSELHVMKYREAMAGDFKDKWEEAVLEEHERMVKHNVWKPVKRDEMPRHAKPLTSTWAMKKKSNGKYRARLNARGFQQVAGEHYQADSISSPVTNDVTIRIVLTLLLMAGWHAEIVDVKGAFLHGAFADGEKMYMEVPEGFEAFYTNGVVLLLLKTLYGLKQAAVAFWKELLKAMLCMGFARSKADPCLYYQWTAEGLVLWVSWIDDCLCVGKRSAVLAAKTELMKRFDCEDVGELTEYVGCKVDRDNADEYASIKVTQPVLVQSFVDEFGICEESEKPATPAAPGSILVKPDEDQLLDAASQTRYRSGVGKLLHLMRWSRPEILNAVRELSRFMSGAGKAHVKAMQRVMAYCVGSAETGLLLQPRAKWNGNKDHVFTIRGSSDSNYATDPDTRKSVSGYSVFLEEAPVAMKSLTQKCVTLSVTEAELYAATLCVQEMLHVMRIMESIGLKVKQPMILEIDNEGAVDLMNNWSVGGRTKHIEVRQYFLRELKEKGIVVTKWKPGVKNESDLFTKNLSSEDFKRHAKKFVEGQS